MKYKKQLFAVGSLVVCGLLYQNCASQGRNVKFREVRIESDAKLEVADQKGQSFLVWNFKLGNETQVEITNRSNAFCKRGFILNTAAEKDWFYALNKIKAKRDTASSSLTKNLKIKYKGNDVELSESESSQFFELMEKTKRGHSVKIIECDGQKKWSFKNFKVEQVVKTKSNSKIVETFTLKIINDKIEMVLDQQPIKISKNQDEAFCNYSGMTYAPTAKLLTAMFSIDEVYKNDNLSGSRGLASAAPENPMILMIDSRSKYTLDPSSALGQSLYEVIDQMKMAKAARKTCGYTY
jgi:hypothetical protein